MQPYLYKNLRMGLFHWLDNIDKQLFTAIHRGLASDLLDRIMLFARDPLVWIPLYCFMLFWIIRYHRKYALQFIVLTGLTVAITDSLAGLVIKPLVQRLRPCHSPDLKGVIRGIIDCGGLYSFPSNHASNHFGMACFWFISIFAITGKKWKWLWFWAALISFAQVYVGKHYPFDVLAGAALGCMTGLASGLIFKKWAFGKNKNVSTH